MLDRFFKAACNKSVEGQPSRVEPAQASLVLPAISIDSATVCAVPPPSSAGCLDDIFSEIISEQPKFGVHV